MDDLIQDLYHLEENKRMGLTLITFYKESHPLGSLLLDPVEDKYLIQSCHELVKAWESNRKQEIERARARRDVRKVKRNGGNSQQT